MSDQPQEPQQFVLQPVVTVQELGVPRVVMPEQTAAQAASEFFNSLPIDQRRKLSPLLEEYRRQGLRTAYDEVAKAHRASERKVRDRILTASECTDAPVEEGGEG